MPIRSFLSVIVWTLLAFVFTDRVAAQHLWWDTQGNKNATCLYGEITVLATHHAIYYCGANWHFGEAAGGYCGIQHNSPQERRTIFSVWDTSATLHPQVSQSDPKTLFNRFGGEGEGAHTHMLWDWQVGDTFQFFVMKSPSTTADTTEARYYVYDRGTTKWQHSATITSPNGDSKTAKSVTTIGGGGLASFLENFGGKDRDIPKLALYRLWLGTDLDHMNCLTKATGDGTWGTLHDCYFLAEGDGKALEALYSRSKERYGEPNVSNKDSKLNPISNQPMHEKVVEGLRSAKAE
jgi:hypothetical protein